MDRLISLDNSPRQSFQVPLAVDGETVTITVTLRYNEVAGYWVMTIYDADGVLLLDSLPLLTGDWPAANLLAPYGYLQIGSAYIINDSHGEHDFPGLGDLGRGFSLVWSDTVLA